MNNYIWKNKDIIFKTYSYNCFGLQKQTSKTHIYIKFDTIGNDFCFIDHKKNLTLNLKYETAETLQSCLKQILGSEEIPMVLFNTHFVLSAKKECCITLKEFVIDLNWDDPVLNEYNTANLICGIESYAFYDKNPCQYNISNSIFMLASRRSVSPHIVYTQKSDMDNTDKHISFARGFQKIKKYIQIENEYGVLNLEKASKIANALYWTNLVTGYGFEWLAEEFNEYEFDELPYNNMYERIKNDNSIMNEVMEKIRKAVLKNYFNSPFGDFSQATLTEYDKNDLVALNYLREDNLHWLIAHAIYSGEVPDNAGAIITSRQQEKWHETRKALLMLHIAKRDTWRIIRSTYTSSEENIVNNLALLLESSNMIYDEYEKSKQMAYTIDEIYRKTNGVNELFTELRKTIQKIKY